jgi:enoyl-CoA hydratase/carnithine racemase
MQTNMPLYDKNEGVATITLNNPASGNLVHPVLVGQMEDVCREISADDGIRAVILTGGEIFSRGTDRAHLSPGSNRTATLSELSLAFLIDALDRPVIAAIRGDAFGQGLELALACDIRICAHDARFAMDQADYGDMPWDGGTQRLPRTVGRGKALQMILCAEVIDAGEAYRTGLVSAVVPAAELMPTAVTLARNIAAKGPLAVRYCREALAKGMDLSLPQGLRLEADLYFLLHTTQDRTEGVTAFREKRPPAFTGN